MACYQEMKDDKAKVAWSYAKRPADNGNLRIQRELLAYRIVKLQRHLHKCPKDYSAKIGMEELKVRLEKLERKIVKKSSKDIIFLEYGYNPLLNQIFTTKRKVKK